MLQTETSQIFDPTTCLSCSYCPLHFNCKKYMLICDLVKKNLTFGAELLCILGRAETFADYVLRKSVKENKGNPFAIARTLYKDFLPTINNYLTAFYKYECEHTKEYDKREIILTLAAQLEYWNLLEHFDFVFSQDVENTRDTILTVMQHETTKSENKKVAAPYEKHHPLISEDKAK